MGNYQNTLTTIKLILFHILGAMYEMMYLIKIQIP